MEKVTLYYHTASNGGGVMQSLFGFPESAKKAAREMGLTKFVVATDSGHVLHSEGCAAALEPAPFTRALTP